MPTLECKFGIADTVRIDGDHAMHAVIVAVEWRFGAARYECSWMASGVAQFVWFDEWRLEKV